MTYNKSYFGAGFCMNDKNNFTNSSLDDFFGNLKNSGS